MLFIIVLCIIGSIRDLLLIFTDWNLGTACGFENRKTEKKTKKTHARRSGLFKIARPKICGFETENKNRKAMKRIETRMKVGMLAF